MPPVSPPAPSPSDADGDGLPDTWEAIFGFSPASAAGDDGPSGDPDGDGVTNSGEFTAGTDPRIANVQNLSEGSTGFFLERIAVANPVQDPAAFKIDFLTESAAVMSQSYSLPGLSRMTISVNSIPGLADTAVSAILTITKGGVVAERLMMWNARDGNYYGGHLGKTVPAARTAWLLAEGEASFFDTYILFANGTGTAANVTTTYLLDNGSTIIRNYVVAPNARLTVFANAVAGLKGRAFSTVVTSSQPITVNERNTSARHRPAFGMAGTKRRRSTRSLLPGS